MSGDVVRYYIFVRILYYLVISISHLSRPTQCTQTKCNRTWDKEKMCIKICLPKHKDWHGSVDVPYEDDEGCKMAAQAYKVSRRHLAVSPLIHWLMWEITAESCLNIVCWFSAIFTLIMELYPT